jgi:antitoxin component of MazEF toxin-antitoxin module
MPPGNSAVASTLYVVVLSRDIVSIYASQDAALDHLNSLKNRSLASISAKVEVHVLNGGSVVPHGVKREMEDSEEGENEVKAPKAKFKATKKAKVDKESEAAPAVDFGYRHCHDRDLAVSSGLYGGSRNHQLSLQESRNNGQSPDQDSGSFHCRRRIPVAVSRTACMWNFKAM